jgi:hypothetical protein
MYDICIGSRRARHRGAVNSDKFLSLDIEMLLILYLAIEMSLPQVHVFTVRISEFNMQGGLMLQISIFRVAFPTNMPLGVAWTRRFCFYRPKLIATRCLQQVNYLFYYRTTQRIRASISLHDNLVQAWRNIIMMPANDDAVWS